VPEDGHGDYGETDVDEGVECCGSEYFAFFQCCSLRRPTSREGTVASQNIRVYARSLDSQVPESFRWTALQEHEKRAGDHDSAC
jgi:hypothetical protein